MSEIKQELSFTEEYLNIYASQWASSIQFPKTLDFWELQKSMILDFDRSRLRKNSSSTLDCDSKFIIFTLSFNITTLKIIFHTWIWK